MNPDFYVDLALKAVAGILEREHAAVWPEIEARASERPWGDLPVHIDPHHLSTAKRLLADDGILVSESASTRGGRSIEVYQLAGAPKRATERAAARKRLLHGRFLGWAMGTNRHPRGLIGGAGEAVTAASLEAAARVGYRLLDRTGGEVTQVFGEDVPGGPLDNGAHLLTMTGDSPGPTVTVLIEVKNVREWLYPQATEVYQLLAKAAQIQHDHPDRLILPVLVCRRAHKTLFKMAKAFGFYVINANRQFILPSADITDQALIEVRHELGYADLSSSDSADKWIQNHFTRSIPRHAEPFARRWSVVGPALVQELKFLRAPMDPLARAEAMRNFRATAAARTGDTGGW